MPLVLRRRLGRTAALVAALLFLEACRVGWLGLVRGPDLAAGAARQRVAAVPTAPPRGMIVDRWGRPLDGTVVAERPVALPGGGAAVVPVTGRYGSGALAHHTLGLVDRGGRGRSGLQAAFDAWLRVAQPDAVGRLADASGTPLHAGPLRLFPGESPRLVTTLDRDAQAAVEAVMDAMVPRGAVVVADARTGDVLAIASRPTFDPSNPAAAFDQPGAPMVHRAVRAYPPGSVFKVVVYAAALEAGVVGPRDRLDCPPELELGDRRFRGPEACRAGGALLTPGDALAYSANPVYIRLGLQVGGERLVDAARTFGFGRPTGVGLPEEQPGHLPDATRFTGPGGPGEVANLAIGQGPVLVTPLQVAGMLVALTRGGRGPDLRLVTRVEARDGRILWKAPAGRGTRATSAWIAEELRNALALAALRGTGVAANPPGVRAAGKTGTTQTGRTHPDGRPVEHAWFAGYFPAHAPRVAIVVLVEDGGSGASVAAPIFRAIAQRLLALGF